MHRQRSRTFIASVPISASVAALAPALFPMYSLTTISIMTYLDCWLWQPEVEEATWLWQHRQKYKTQVWEKSKKQLDYGSAGVSTPTHPTTHPPPHHPPTHPSWLYTYPPMRACIVKGILTRQKWVVGWDGGFNRDSCRKCANAPKSLFFIGCDFLF